MGCLEVKAQMNPAQQWAAFHRLKQTVGENIIIHHELNLDRPASVL
jgi:hypothetical protein